MPRAEGKRRLLSFSWAHYPAILGVAFVLLWIAMAIAPWERDAWVLENSPVLVAVAVWIACLRLRLFSRLSYTLIFVFMCLHQIGAHYTYARVPYDAWFETLTGRTFNGLVGWERNHYDRLVHFSYGLLLAYPVREVFLRVADVRGFWGYFLPLDLTLSTSAVYELIEWASAAAFGSGLGHTFLGSQGDEWDAQKDMALAGTGALIAMCAIALVNWRTRRDFAREWSDSLRVKHRAPPIESEASGKIV